MLLCLHRFGIAPLATSQVHPRFRDNYLKLELESLAVAALLLVVLLLLLLSRAAPRFVLHFVQRVYLVRIPRTLRLHFVSCVMHMICCSLCTLFCLFSHGVFVHFIESECLEPAL